MIKVYQEVVYRQRFREGLEQLLNEGWELASPPVFFTVSHEQTGLAVLRRTKR
jgi:hypothetical protein